MVSSIEYVTFDPGLDMNTKYLTETMAYFLGGIFASEEEVTNAIGNYKIAPVRYNYNAASEMEIIEHYELVKALAKKVNGYTVMAENIRGGALDSKKNKMPGFSTFFKSTSFEDLHDMIPRLKSALFDSPWSVRRAFIVGIYDGRGSADINKNTQNVRMFALDCITNEVGYFLSEIIESCNIRYNYNTHRDRLEGGRPRNPQLRIRDVEKFVREIGLISPRRINLLKQAYEYNYSFVTVVNEDSVLEGLKSIIVR